MKVVQDSEAALQAEYETEAASWAEAEARVREMWENGEVVIGQSDFAGNMISSGG